MSHEPFTPDSSISRRRFIEGAAAVGAVTIVGAPKGAEAATPALKWSERKTWGGKRPPGRNSDVVIRKKILLDVNATVKSLTIAPGGALIFHRRRNITLKCRRNMIVKGLLKMRPARPWRLHRILFPEVDESKFVGGGEGPIATDIGMWVVGAGRLNISGSAKLGWSSTTAGVPVGATSVTLKHDPSGWRVGDDIIITPTKPPTSGDFAVAYDSHKIKAISGRKITLNSPTTLAHPAVNVGRGKVMTPEVANLTRNVRVEGAPGKRAHIFIKSSKPQIVQYASIRHLGPRKPVEFFTEGVLGRYGIHFHHCFSGSRTSMMRGLVARDIGNHAFATHESDGVTYRDCVTHDTYDEPYWYDGAPNLTTPGPPTNGLLYDRCLASLVKVDPTFRGFGLSGFFLGRGVGNVCRNCVAVGVQGNVDASGFIWPEGSEGVWVFEDNIAHNCRRDGIFTWQNTGKNHVIDRFIAYHCGRVGIAHGAYLNPYRYLNSILYGNKDAGFAVHANATADGPTLDGIILFNILCDGAGISKYGFQVEKHTLEPALPTLIQACECKNYTDTGIAWIYTGSNGASTQELFDIMDCTFDGNEFHFDDFVRDDSLVRVKQGTDYFALRPFDHAEGELNADWNAKVMDIEPFTSPSTP